MNLITCEACAIILWSSYVNTKGINCFAFEIKIADRIIQWVPNLKPRYRNMSLCEFGPKIFAFVLCAQICASAIWCLGSCDVEVFHGSCMLLLSWWIVCMSVYAHILDAEYMCYIYCILHSTWSVFCFIIFLFMYVPFVANSVLHLCYLQ